MSSASQWKRCFTNPDSWMKWNIFSALFLGLELADLSIPTSRDTPHHICLSHTWGTRKTRIFLHKRCGFLGVARVRLLCFPSPWQSHGLLQGLIHKDFIQLLLGPWEFSLSLVLLKANNKSFIQIQPEVWDTRRGHWKGKVAPTAPSVLWHIQVWGGKEIPLQDSSQCKNLGIT